MRTYATHKEEVRDTDDVDHLEVVEVHQEVEVPDVERRSLVVGLWMSLLPVQHGVVCPTRLCLVQYLQAPFVKVPCAVQVG